MLYITVIGGLRGYFAVLIDDSQGFPEPIQTSPISCKTMEEARDDARKWAEAEGISYLVD